MADPIEFSRRHRVVKRNTACAYCAQPLVDGGEAEHVIGRRFVPKGTFAGQWNLILRACGPCNDAKADLEDDISAITMQPDAIGRHSSDDPRLKQEAVRKARTRNRRTMRRVSEPTPPIVVKGQFGPAEFTFSFKSPAQADDRRLFELARLQLVGFFYFLTYDDTAQRGHYWPGVFAPVAMARKEDWGNPRLRWIETIAQPWEHRLHALTADGFYKLWIRRRLGEPAVWAWAMEWNQGFRLAGFFGDEGFIRTLVEDMPSLNLRTVHEQPGRRLRMRNEIPLAEADDTLFDLPRPVAANG